jgi:hypothetical protein
LLRNDRLWNWIPKYGVKQATEKKVWRIHIMRGAIVTAASLSVLLLGAQLVRADEITTTTVQQQVPAGTLVPVQPDANATFIYGSSGNAPTNVTSFKFNEFGGAERYACRLSKMRDQIDLGVQRGFITADQAIRLNAKYSELASQEAQVRADGFAKGDSDILEKNMNVFNVEISHALSHGMRTAGAGSTQ